MSEIGKIDINKMIALNGAGFELALAQKINEIVDFCNDIYNAREFLERHEKNIEEIKHRVEDCQIATANQTTKVDVIFSRIDQITDAMAEQKDNTPEECLWVGKLCRFWFDNKNTADFGILGVITPANTENRFFNRSSNRWYKNCEPIDPSDDIIY